MWSKGGTQIRRNIMKGPMFNQETKPKSANAPTRVAKYDSGDQPKGKH